MIVAARGGRRSSMTIGVKLGAPDAVGALAWLEPPHGVPVDGAEAELFAPLMSVARNA
jgi:hypothetical protein